MDESGKGYWMARVWEKYGYEPPENPEPEGEAVFEAKDDCFAYNNGQHRCTRLTRTWCKYEECRFYKTEEQYQLDLIDSMRCN